MLLWAPGLSRATSLLGLIMAVACSTGGGTSLDMGDGSGAAASIASGGTTIVSTGGGGIGSGGDVGSGGQDAGASGGTLVFSGGAEGDGGAHSGSGSGGGESSGGTGGGGGSGGVGPDETRLSWPIDWPVDCVPESTCYDLGYPDADEDGVAFDCGEPGYQAHEGTDIPITWDQMDAGVAVRAAADGVVFFASDGKYDRCPDDGQPDCQNPPAFVAGSTEGTTVCTELGPYCNPPGGSCFWCFAGGNVIVILHDTVEGVFATRYDHLRNGSVNVAVGETVTRGQQIAQVGSAGNSSGPHLHFEVWGNGYYDVVEPWAGTCGPNTTEPLWVADPPWEE